MKTGRILTILLGSPRNGGNSEELALALERGALAAGCEVRKARLSALNLKGCIGCGKCWSAGKPCILADDMDLVYKDIEAADVVAFASPLYFYSWSWQIKAVWDRLLAFYHQDSKSRLAGKDVILLSAAGDKDMEAFTGLKYSFRLAIKYLKWNMLGEICIPGVHHAGEITAKAPEWLEATEKLGMRL
ncbi:MAG: flavodoxin family protein [Synergistaceae bacterium]|nr:flavodoxin family protein [Synergistaceae bacterium]